VGGPLLDACHEFLAVGVVELEAQHRLFVIDTIATPTAPRWLT
jgi:hypothetical protein